MGNTDSSISTSGAPRRLIGRRAVLRGMTIGAMALAGCGNIGNSQTYPTRSVTDQKLLRKHHVGIPEKTVKIALLPFGDHMAMSLAYMHGWFGEVGINVPNRKATADLDQLQALLLNGTYDLITNYIPDQIRNMQNVPEVDFLGVMDNTNGTAILARPGSGFKTASSKIEAADDWKARTKQVLRQMAGKRFGMEDVGAHRTFIDTLLRLAGMSFEDFGEVTTGKDEQLILLANGGKLDFVLPQGGAQEAHLIHQGWYPIVDKQALVDNLASGDGDAVQSIGHVGLSLRKDFYHQDKQTALRAASVMFRVIDLVHDDVENSSLKSAKAEAPILASATGTDIKPDEVFTIYKDVSRFLPFEQQAGLWANPNSRTYYKTVYNPQIQHLRRAGTLTDKSLRATDVVGVAADVYESMSRLKRSYEQYAPRAKSLTGEHGRLAALAKQHYRIRNYVDAVRIIRAALGE